jgi:hypothetical protein
LMHVDIAKGDRDKEGEGWSAQARRMKSMQERGSEAIKMTQSSMYQRQEQQGNDHEHVSITLHVPSVVPILLPTGRNRCEYVPRLLVIRESEGQTKPKSMHKSRNTKCTNNGCLYRRRYLSFPFVIFPFAIQTPHLSSCAMCRSRKRDTFTVQRSGDRSELSFERRKSATRL